MHGHVGTNTRIRLQEREALQRSWQQRQKEAEQVYKDMEGQLQTKVRLRGF